MQNEPKITPLDAYRLALEHSEKCRIESERAEKIAEDADARECEANIAVKKAHANLVSSLLGYRPNTGGKMRVTGCPSSECAKRNHCTGAVGCPRGANES